MSEENKKSALTILAWILAAILIADFYFQFFTKNFWLDHLLPFIRKFVR